MSRILLRVILGWATWAGTSASGRAAETDPPPLAANSELRSTPDTPGSVLLALADLRRDLEAVATPLPGTVPPARAAAVEVIVGSDDLPEPETYRVRWAPPGPVSGTIRVEGSDARGAIHGLYELSRRHLGVDPWWFWMDHDPVVLGPRPIPADLNLTAAPPVYAYRGFFINDEDLLAAWRPDPRGRSLLDDQTWDRIFETILRLRGNLVVPGTFVFPDEPPIALAAARGLVVNQHHQTPLGFVGYRWPRDRPFSPTRDLATLRRAWDHAIGLHGDIEAVWTLGLRGVNRNDAAFWRSDPHAPADDLGRAAVLQAALAAQSDLVLLRRGAAAPRILNLWHEGVDLLRSGHLVLPPGVVRVWPDDGYGRIRDGGLIAPGDGVYYHTAYMNGHANQLTEMVHPDRIVEELGRAQDAGATAFLLVNVSDIRPVPRSTDLVMQIAADGAGPTSIRPARGTEHGLEWARRQFGDAAAATVAAIQRTYFERQPAFEGGTVTLAGEHAYFRLQEHLSGVARNRDPEATAGDFGFRIAAADLPVERLLDRIEAFTAEADAAWAALEADARAARELVPSARRDAYDHSILAQIRIHLHGNRLLRDTARAAVAARRGEIDSAIRSAREALVAVRAVSSVLRDNERGRWAGFHRGDDRGFVHVSGSEEIAEDLVGFLVDGRPPRPREGRSEATYRWIQSYQGERVVEIPDR